MPATTNDTPNNMDTEFGLLKLELSSRDDLPDIDVMQAYLSDDIDTIRKLLQRQHRAANSPHAETTHRPPAQPLPHTDQQVTQEQQVRHNTMRQLQRSWKTPQTSHVTPAQPRLDDANNVNTEQHVQDKCCGIM